MKKVSLTIWSLIYVLFGFGQNYNYDQEYYRLYFEVDPAVRYIKGEVTIYFSPSNVSTDNMSLELSSLLSVDSILFHGQKLTFVHDNDIINVNFPSTVSSQDSITVFYQGEPPEGDFAGFTVSSHNQVPVMWTLSEPYGAKDWFPVKQELGDKIDSMDMIVSVPEGYNVAGNGVIVEDYVSNSHHIVHWKTRYPITPYLVAFAVTNYDIYYDYANIGDTLTIPVQNFVYPEDYDYAKESTPDVARTLEFYSDKFGIYPFYKEKYGQAQFGWGGGMEHQTITFLYDFSHSLMAHELAHQWFGDYITCGSWHEIYLNEAFATYLEGLTAEAGIAPYSWYDWKSDKINRVLEYGKTGSVYVDDTTSIARIFSSTLTYNKGALFLHLVRWTIGDSAFFAALRNYLNDPALANGFAHTEDLKRHFEQACNCDLTYLFDDWIYGKGYPVYKITWEQDKNKTLHLQLNQSVTDPSVDFFELKVPLELVGEDADTVIVLNNTAKTQDFYVNLDFWVKNIVFDPQKWLISKATISSEPIDVSVYPTITENVLNVSFGSGAYVESWSVYNLSGIKVMSGNNFYAGSFVINLENLPAGIYIVEILLQGEQPVRKKIIKL